MANAFIPKTAVAYVMNPFFFFNQKWFKALKYSKSLYLMQALTCPANVSTLMTFM